MFDKMLDREIEEAYQKTYVNEDIKDLEDLYNNIDSIVIDIEDLEENLIFHADVSTALHQALYWLYEARKRCANEIELLEG